MTLTVPTPPAEMLYTRQTDRLLSIATLEPQTLEALMERIDPQALAPISSWRPAASINVRAGHLRRTNQGNPALYALTREGEAELERLWWVAVLMQELGCHRTVATELAKRAAA